jgi:hypothetical protein
MNLIKAITTTAKDWKETGNNLRKYLSDKSHYKELLWFIWIVFPIWVGITMYAFYLNDIGLIVVISGFIATIPWAFFWFDVYLNTGVVYATHYDETEKKWVIDYNEEVTSITSKGESK